SSISLNQAIHLQWADNAALSDTARFNWYRVYSMPYDLDHGVFVTRPDSILLEGTTVSDEFLATLLANGVPRCFGVSAISVEGYESLWSPLKHDTPRPDARNVLVSAFEVNAAQSGFRFWSDANGNGRGDPGELGLVQDGNRTDIDFWVHLQASDSTLWIVPEFAGDSIRLYDNTQAVPDLTSIDSAAASGYTRNMIQAVPGFGYVFQRNENNQYHYAALRVTAVGRRYVIVDRAAASGRRAAPSRRRSRAAPRYTGWPPASGSSRTCGSLPSVPASCSSTLSAAMRPGWAILCPRRPCER